LTTKGTKKSKYKDWISNVNSNIIVFAVLGELGGSNVFCFKNNVLLDF